MTTTPLHQEAGDRLGLGTFARTRPSPAPSRRAPVGPPPTRGSSTAAPAACWPRGPTARGSRPTRSPRSTIRTFAAISVLALAPVAWWTGVLVSVLLLVERVRLGRRPGRAAARRRQHRGGVARPHHRRRQGLEPAPGAACRGLYRATSCAGVAARPLAYSAVVVGAVLRDDPQRPGTPRRQAGVTMPQATPRAGTGRRCCARWSWHRPRLRRAVPVVHTQRRWTTGFAVVYALLALATAGYRARAALVVRGDAHAAPSAPVTPGAVRRERSARRPVPRWAVVVAVAWSCSSSVASSGRPSRGRLGGRRPHVVHVAVALRGRGRARRPVARGDAHGPRSR